MAGEGHGVVAFDAIRQFKAAPDRRYRVELRNSALTFRTTGSQFDAQWLARGARQFLGDRIANALEGLSKRQILSWGVGVTVVSGLLLVLLSVQVVSSNTLLRGKDYKAASFIMFAFIVGLIMIIAGLSTRGSSTEGDRHDFSLLLSNLADVSLLPPQPELTQRGEPQAARVELVPRSGKPIRLSIPTDADLEAIKQVVPRLR